MTKKLQEIEVTIMPNGKTIIDARGFTGDACLKETASLEEALGKLNASRSMKPEAMAKSQNTTKVTLGS